MDRVHAGLCRLRSTRRFDMQRAPMFRSSWIRGRSMDTSLEERVRVLEASRYAMIGRINALQTLVINALTDIVIRNAPDPVGTAERMRESGLLPQMRCLLPCRGLIGFISTWQIRNIERQWTPYRRIS
jgi:hypothetical protein